MFIHIGLDVTYLSIKTKFWKSGYSLKLENGWSDKGGIFFK